STPAPTPRSRATRWTTPTGTAVSSGSGGARTACRTSVSRCPSGSRDVGASVAGVSAQPLGLRTAALRFEAPPPGPSRWFGGLAFRRGRGDGLAEQFCQPLGRGLAVAQLRTELRGRHGDLAVDHAIAEAGQGPLDQRFGDRLARGQVEDEFDARVGGVDPLPARP